MPVLITLPISQTSGRSAHSNLTNAIWLLNIHSPSDIIYCISHLDRNCSINTLAYPSPLTASFCCQVKDDWFPPPPLLPQNVWLLGPRIFPPLFAPSPTGRAVSALTLRQTWPSACWHDLPLRPELARWTAVDAGPRNTASLKTHKTTGLGGLLKRATISPQQAHHNKNNTAFCAQAYASLVKALSRACTGTGEVSNNGE